MVRVLSFLVAGVLALLVPDLARTGGGRVLVEAGSTMHYLANVTDPGFGATWIEPDFDDTTWQDGRFGIGKDSSVGGKARALFETHVPVETRSIYTRTEFTIDKASSVQNLFLGMDYDDGYVAWINGVEVHRSKSMPAGAPGWDSSPYSHESSNGSNPIYLPVWDIAAKGIPALKDGRNILAIGAWNHDESSSDLVLVPWVIANQPQGIFVSRGPYLQQGTPSSVVVRWRTHKPTDSRVTYGLLPDKLDHSVTDRESTTEHGLQICGLEPDTTYYYSVGSSQDVLTGADSEHCFRTAPLPGSRVPVRVWVVGDAGTDSYRAGGVRDGYQIYSGGREPSFWLLLGDNAYPRGSDDNYQRAIFDASKKVLARTVVWSTMGNHDSVDTFDPPRGVYYDVFDLPTQGEAGGLASGTEDYYSFDYANVHFVCLSSEIPSRAFPEMLEWLRRDLKATKMDWIVAYWHRAPYGRGLHDSDKERRMMLIREQLLPVLDELGVDLALTGHTHAYSRTALLWGHYGPAASLMPEHVVDAGDGRADGTGAYRKTKGRHGNQGIVYVVAGSGAWAAEKKLDHPAIRIGLKRIGSLSLEIEGDRLDARFVDWKGEVLDYFTILKEQPPVASRVTE